MTSRAKKIIAFIIIALVIAAWASIVSIISPDEIVAKLGVENTYAVIGTMAVLGGVSAITAAPFYAALTTFAAGGANIWLLGLIAGIGLIISDSLFFYFGLKGREMISPKMQAREIKLSAWLEGKPEWLLPVGIFMYSGFTPFPNDIMTVSLAILEYPYRRLFVPLLLGDITSSILIAYLGTRGVLIFG